MRIFLAYACCVVAGGFLGVAWLIAQISDSPIGLLAVLGAIGAGCFIIIGLIGAVLLGGGL